MEVCIGVQMVATRAPNALMAARNELWANCNVLPLRCGDMSTTETIREEVNVQCVK